MKRPPIELLFMAGPKVALPEYSRDRRTIAHHAARSEKRRPLD